MKVITVMFRDEDVDTIKVSDLMEKIGEAASEMGLVVDAVFEVQADQADALSEFVDSVDLPQVDDSDNWPFETVDLDLT